MNTKLVESLIQIINTLEEEERSLLEVNLFSQTSSPSTNSLMQLAKSGASFDFLDNEPDLYTLEDGEPL